MKIRPLLSTGCLIAAQSVFLTSVKAASFSDNFDSYSGATTYTTGPDVSAGWSHYPGANIGLGNTWTFPVISGANQGYRLFSNFGSTPNPGRVGSVYTGITTADFYVQADLVNWSTNFGQYMGVAARYTSGGPVNFPTAYGLVLRNDQVGPGGASALQITKLDNVSGSTILTGNQGFFNVAGSSAAPDPLGDYQLQFWGIGNTLIGRIVDLSTGVPMLFNDGSGGLQNFITATDSTYASGQTGLLGFIRTNQGVDPTYDNFLVTTVVPEPTIAALAGLGFAALLVYRRRK